MKIKILILSLALTQTIGCGSGIPVPSVKEDSGTIPSTGPSYSLDLVAVQGGITVAIGKNATSSGAPKNCAGPQLAVNKLFQAARKVAFGVSSTAFFCGDCEIKIKCVPGTTVSVIGERLPNLMLLERTNELCPAEGEINITPLESIADGNVVDYRYTLTSGSDSDVEYFTCVDPG